MILVTGARGQVGSRVNTMLENLSVDTIPVARQETTTTSGRPCYVGDLSRPETMREALDQSDQIFLYPDFGIEFVELMAEAKPGRVVLLSSSWVEVNPKTAIADKHARCEDMLRTAGLEYTMLRPDTFMTNDHFWLPEIRQGAVHTAFPQALTAPIACADIARVAVNALLEGSFVNESVLLTGDQTLSQRDRIRVIADHLGTAIQVEVISEEEMRTRFGQLMARAYADEMIDGMLASRDEPLAPAGGFGRATGRSAIRYRDWVGGDESRFGR
jgi:uncharacterized protein YbjT (DUF2867 family)